MCVTSTLVFKKHDIINLIIKGFSDILPKLLTVSVEGKSDRIMGLEKGNLSQDINYLLLSGKKVSEGEIKFSKEYDAVVMNKKKICRLFELLCRYNKEKNNKNNYLSYDEMWLKYPPFNFDDRTEIQ